MFVQWATEDLPKMCLALEAYGHREQAAGLRVEAVALREQVVEALGKYCLLGEAAAVKHTPILLKIALIEDEADSVRMSAMKVCRGCTGINGGITSRRGMASPCPPSPSRSHVSCCFLSF